IIHILRRKGAEVVYSDPYIATVREPGLELDGVPLATLRQADCAVIVTDHGSFDLRQIVRDARLIVDTRNALRGFNLKKIYGL
ncbi:MAG: UDP binding domain-containing protein, partial [Terriglobales bacterium]